MAVEFHGLVKPLKLGAYLTDQLARASTSIALNLAEGNAKFSQKDKNRFYQMALGSMRECQVIFRLHELKDEKVLKLADQLAASIYKLTQSLK